MTPLRNLIVFLSTVIFRLPPWRWPSAWRQIQADHEAEVHQAILALRLAGRVRMDEDGRLWTVDKD